MNPCPYLEKLAATLSVEVVKDLIKIYEHQMEESRRELLQCLRARDFDKASQVAHKMKSSSLNVGAFEIGEIFQALEKQTSVWLNESIMNVIDSKYQSYKKQVDSWRSSS